MANSPSASEDDLRFSPVICLLALLASLARAGELDDLASDDPARVAAAVSAIEAAPASPDVRFAAARACEDRLADPARALALYEQILRESPDAGVAIAAERRAGALREQVGDRADRARSLSALIATADVRAEPDVIAAADALAAARWPGAPGAALWLAEWLRRIGRFADADARYRAVIARWPASPEAALAAAGVAGCALDARDWDRAEQLAAALPAEGASDRLLRDNLLRDARRGRRAERLYAAAWIALAGALALLVASLADACLRGGRRRPPLAPIELWFAAPIAVFVIAAVAIAERPLVPAAATISLAGVAAVWLSGAARAALRARGRPSRVRTLVQLAAVALALAAAGYLAVVGGHVIELVAPAALADD